MPLNELSQVGRLPRSPDELVLEEIPGRWSLESVLSSNAALPIEGLSANKARRSREMFG